MEKIQRVCELKAAVAQFNCLVLSGSHSPISFLRPRQIEALYRLKEKRDAIVVLPTGYGKSLIFELIPFYVQCKVVIVEPLNAILHQLKGRLGHHLFQIPETFEETQELLSGSFRYISGHPESIVSEACLEYLAKAEWTKQPVCLVIDEAHCLLHWQDEFRPAYKQLKTLRAVFTNCVVCAMTATMNKDSIKALKGELKMKQVCVVNTTLLLRKNISLNVKRRSQFSTDTIASAPYDYVFKPLFEQLAVSLAQGIEFPITIVYTRLIWCSKAIQLASILLGDQMYAGVKDPHYCRVVQYHAPQDQEVNNYILTSLSQETTHIRIVFATVALGMGADLKKVHKIVHAGPPTSIEEYIQEVGRSGRDGLEATATIYYNTSDLSSKILEKDMKEYLMLDSSCRRAFVTSYFDCVYENAQFACCDICTNSITNSTEQSARGQNQITRYLVHLALKEYVRADESGDIRRHLSDDLLMRIVETFDIIPLCEHDIAQYYQIPTFIAGSIRAIIHTFHQ